MGKFAIKLSTQTVSWLVAGLIAALNFKLVFDEVRDWIKESHNIFIDILILAGAIGLILLLIMTVIYPFVLRRRKHAMDIHTQDQPPKDMPEPHFKTIAMAVDFSATDNQVIRYALKMAEKDTRFVLIHVTESASSTMMEAEAEDFETRRDRARMELYLRLIRDEGYEVDFALGFLKRTREIARICKEQNADMLIVGSHGHRGLKDFIFGETVNKVRHLVKIPVLVAQ